MRLKSWVDERISWRPADYNHLRVFRIPASKLWLPDIVLYNRRVYFFPSVCPHMYKSDCISAFPILVTDKFVPSFVFARWRRSFIYCSAMLCKRGRPMPSCGVSVRPSVRPSVTFVNSVKKSNHMFSPSGSQTILVFFNTKRHGSIPMGTS